jgi:hypothetical protein
VISGPQITTPASTNTAGPAIWPPNYRRSPVHIMIRDGKAVITEAAA